MTGHYLSKIERGDVRTPNSAYRSALREVLGVSTDAELGFGPRQRSDNELNGSAGRTIHGCLGWDVVEIAKQFANLPNDDLAMSIHRPLMVNDTLAGADLYAELEPFLWTVISVADHDGKPITGDELDAFARITRDLCFWHTHPGMNSCRVLIAQLKELSRRVSEAPSKSSRTRKLFRIAAELASAIASVHWDKGDHSFAQRFFILAAQFAHAAGDVALAASKLTLLARQCFDLDRPDDGLEIVQLAQYATRHCATPRLRALLATREGWAYAQRGEERKFHRVVGLSEDHHAEGLQEADVDVTTLASLDEAELYGVNGARYRDLAWINPKYARTAQGYIGRALELRDPSRVRERTFDLVGLGRAHLITREPERAAELVGKAISLAECRPRGRIKVRLCDFYREAALFKDISCVRDIREAIKEISVE